MNDLLSSSSNYSLRKLWSSMVDTADPSKPSMNSKNNKFLGAKFRSSINSLMSELGTCDSHFIRCIKPNELKTPNDFEEPFVML